MVNQVVNMDDEDKMTYFKNGLHSDTAEQIDKARAKTWEEHVEIAASIEFIKEKKALTKMQNGIVKPYRREFKPSDSHIGETRKGTYDISKIQCFKCKKFGHYSTNCTEKGYQKDGNITSYQKLLRPGLRKPSEYVQILKA